MSKNYVLYHANCFDGSGAAYAAWAALGDKDTAYIPVQYGEAPPEMESGSNIYIVDFSYPKDVLTGLLDASEKLVVLDHHKTAKEALEGFPGAVFDMDKSGAILAWEYFHKDKPAPDLLHLIQDRDLWRWQDSRSKPVTSYLRLLKDFREYHPLALFPSELHLAGEGGMVKNQFDDMEIESAVKKAVVCLYGRGTHYKCGVVNTTVLVSEIGNAICTQLPVDFSLTYFIEKSGDVVFSFRSVGNFDVSALAKELGGGGHRSAAGARVRSAAGLSLVSALHASQVE